MFTTDDTEYLFLLSDSTYADILLARAKKLYSFANQSTKGKYSDTITDANTFYQ